MHRLDDWESRLGEYLAGHRRTPFAWGIHDCVLFAAGAVEALTGVDPAADVRGRYATAIGSKRTLTRMGYASVEALADAHLSRTNTAMAQRGDVVMADGSLGVCVGRDALFPGTDGLERLPRAVWQAAWSV